MRIDRLKSTTRIYFSFHFLLCLILCMGCSITWRQSLAAEKIDYHSQNSFRFAVAADPQLFRGKKEDLDRAVELINNFEPAFLVICGDLIEMPSNQQQIDAYKDATSKLSSEISLYHVPGNHDLGQPVKIENISVYQEHFGDLWYHFQHGNSLFIVLSSDILRDPNAPMHKQQTEWLITILEQFHPKTITHVFVFMHHPLYLNSPDEPNGYSNMPVGIRKEMLDLFAKHRVRVVFSGHLHDNRINSYQGVDQITTNSITVPMAEEPAGFRIVDVNQDGYEQRYYRIEQFDKQE